MWPGARKGRSGRLVATGLAALLVGLTVRARAGLEDETFTIVQLPDPHSFHHGSFWEYWQGVSDFLASKKEPLNIVAVVSPGDNTFFNDPLAYERWTSNAFRGIIVTNGLPLVAGMGNHEVYETGTYTYHPDYTNFSDLYIGALITNQPSFKGSLDGRLNTMFNSYYLLTNSSMKFLYWCLPYVGTWEPPNAPFPNNVTNYAKYVREGVELCKQYPDHLVIAVIHSYLDEDGVPITGGEPKHPPGVWAWEYGLKDIPNLKMILCGHQRGGRWARAVQTGTAGNKVQALLFNTQFSLTNCWKFPVRYYRVHPSNGLVGAYTWDRANNTNFTMGSNPLDSQFSFSLSQVNTGSPPTISTLPDVQGHPTAGPLSLRLMVTDEDSPDDYLMLSGSSSNPRLLPDANMAFSGSGSNRTVRLDPIWGVAGTSVVTVVVTDATGLSASSTFEYTAIYFEDVPLGLPGGTGRTPRFGDFDADGDWDLYLAGALYRNEAGGHFTQAAALPSGPRSGISWGDYDNDGDLDLVIAGPGPTRIYRNKGQDAFKDIGVEIPSAVNAAVSWVDYDNDGDLDLAFLGDVGSGRGRMYQNEGQNRFVGIDVGIGALYRSAAAWGDYDKDGDLDLLASGLRTGTNYSVIYRNDDGTFLDIGAGLAPLAASSVSWGDYDNDGYLDVLLSGSLTGDHAMGVYHNNRDGTFSDIGMHVPGTSSGTAEWVDFNNDGFLDIFLCGVSATLPAFDYATLLFVNNQDGTFSNVQTFLPKSSLAAWADVDLDGDLDVFLTGIGSDNSRLCLNRCIRTNTPPFAPSGLTSTVLPDNRVLLRWFSGHDVENTNPLTLTYALRVGGVPGGVDIASPQSDPAKGFRCLPVPGPINTTYWFLNAVPKGTYYWSVQSIDAGLAGSPFAAEATFAITNNPPSVSAIPSQSVLPNTVVGPISLTVSDDETLASNLLVTVHSEDTNIIPQDHLVLSGGGTLRALTALPAPNRAGAVPIAVRVEDEGGLVASTTFLLTVERYAAIDAGLAYGGPVAWGDFDQDADLDLVCGSALHINNGDGSFSRVPVSLRPGQGSVSWGDHDNDGDLDLLVTGANACRVYRNDGQGVFTDLEAGLPAADHPWSQGAWGDYDNDGDLDLLLANALFTRVYRNDGTNRFVDIGANLPPLPYGSAAWGDYNNDGHLDLLLAGNGLLCVYRNAGQGTFLQDPSLSSPGFFRAAVAWGDFDNDNDLDFVVAGSTNDNVTGATTWIYRNDSNVDPTESHFALVNGTPSHGPPGLWNGTVAWGDYDRDGDLDLLVSGESCTNGAAGSAMPLTRIYRNDDGVFKDSGHALPGLRSSFAAWGDFDNDGRLDLALAGLDAAHASVAYIYRDFSVDSENTWPSPPGGLSAQIIGKSGVFTWSSAGDLNQNSGLTYNVRVGTTPGADDVVASMSVSQGRHPFPHVRTAGWRRVPRIGNAGHRLNHTITGLHGGTYYWSVQAVDASFAGSAFATEQMITVSNKAPLAQSQSITVPEDARRSLALAGSDADSDPITFRIVSTPQFGTLIGTAPHLIYRPAADYWGFDQFTFVVNDRTTDSLPATVFIQVTPVPDLTSPKLAVQRPPGEPLRLQIVTEPWRRYRIEVSDDLVHWGTLTNILNTHRMTELLDTDAANRPARFYRATEVSVVPALEPGGPLKSNRFQFRFMGEPGRNLQVQTSTNLTVWTPLTNVLLSQPEMLFQDDQAALVPKRFYRIVAP